MQLKTILNAIEKFPGFVYGLIVLVTAANGKMHLDVNVRSRRNSRACCSGCGIRRVGYDTLKPPRRFEHVPLWGIPVFLVYSMRRVECPRCGVIVEMVPWADGKRRVTKSFAWFLAVWARRMSWRETASAFGTSWDNVFRSVEMAVNWGRAHMSLEGIEAVGIDEIHWGPRQGFLTLVYQIDEGRRRLLWIGQHRKAETLLAFFKWFGPTFSSRIRFVCSDMWKPYLTVVAQKAAQAIHVLDRFHIAKHMGDAINEVRAEEARDLRKKGRDPVLTRTKWIFLKRPQNLTPKQDTSLAQLLRLNLRTVRAYLLREDFEFFWSYVSPTWAGKFLDRWTTRALRSRLEPMKKVARMLRAHRTLLLNWQRARGLMSSAAVEGMNNMVKAITKRAYGFRTYRAIEVALYHNLGKLPEPPLAHRFC